MLSTRQPLSPDEAESLMYELEERLAPYTSGPRMSGMFGPSARAEAQRVCEAAASGKRVDLSALSEDGALFLLAAVQRFWIELGRGTASLTPPPGEEAALGMLWQTFLDPGRPH